MKTVREIMSTDVVHLSPQDNIYEAAAIMKDRNIGMIPVIENGALTGVVTDRDLVLRGVAERKPNSSSIRDVMSDKLVYGTPDMSVEEAAQIMAEAQVRRLPILENDQLVGVVSIGDVALQQPNENQVAGEALSEISETHNPEVSSDVQLR